MLYWLVYYPLCTILILLIFCILVEIYDKHSEYGKLRREFPGPELKPIVGNMFDIITDPETMFGRLRGWCKEYPIFKLMPWQCTKYSAINLYHPDDLQLVLGNSDHGMKSDIYMVFLEWLGEGLLVSNGDKWHQRRKILTPTFHFNILKRFVPIFNKHATKLHKELQSEVHQEVNILHHLHSATLHSVAESAMGITINDAESEKKYRSSVARMGSIIYYRILRPWFYFRLPWFFTKFFYEERFLLWYLRKLTKTKIAERQKNFNPSILEDNLDHSAGDPYKNKKRLAMLDLLLMAKQQTQIDDEGIREEVDTFIFEGHDTVSNALAFTFMLLANNPDVQEKVYEEMVSILGNADHEPTYEDLQNMSYTDMVIKESLRLYPSVPLVSRITGEQPIKTSHGYTIPPGTNLLLHFFDTHRLEEFYPDPEKFDPDRFTPEECERRHPYAYIPFSAGARNCIGQRFAMLTMKSMIAAVVRKFILFPVDTPETVVLVCDIVMRCKGEIKVKLQPRQSIK